MSDGQRRPPFDSLTLRAVVHELRDALVGGQVQDVRQPEPTELRLSIRSHGRTRTVALSCDARFARVHFTSEKSPNAQTPSSFCMAVRRHCEGSIVTDIRQRGFDRILEIEFGSRGDSGPGGGPTLVAELMGKHSNIILLSPESTILDAAKRISRRVNRVREILPGLLYAPPPGQGERLDPFAEETIAELVADLHARPCDRYADIAARLVDCVSGMSPFLAHSIAMAVGAGDGEPPARLESEWRRIFGSAATGEFRPVVLREAGLVVGAYPFSIAHLPESCQPPADDLNTALDEAYRNAVADAGISSVSAEIRGQIQRERKRLARQQEAAERTLREAGRAEEYRELGELLRANMWKIGPGDASVTVQDYFDPDLRDREIPLDPKVSSQENVEVIFRRYRKARDSTEIAHTRRSEVADQLRAVDEALAKIDALIAGSVDERHLSVGSGADTVARLKSVREDLRNKGLLTDRAELDPQDKGPDLEGHKIRRVTTPEGYEILVGESATANDFLTTRLAAPTDLWLHVRAATSAHVVIKARGRPEAVPRSVILVAALLCARHSSQKHSGLVPIDYTLKKYVRKPRGSAPGSADYQREATIEVTP